MNNKMWMSSKLDPETWKEHLFTELFTECRLAAPGARLSYSILAKLNRISEEDRKEIVSRVKDGCAPLFVACKKGNIDIVEYLITHCGANVEQRGMYEVPEDHSLHYVTPLWCASVAGKLPVVKCLVEHGANVNSVSDTGSTPVRSACFMTHFEVVVYLVDNHADIQRPNYNGGTCLINSVQSVRLCEFLLNSGANVNAQDIQFKTALHYSIQEFRIETTMLLLDKGANPFIKSRYNDDALQTACLKGANQVFNMLRERFDYSPERIAEAHELMGTTYLDEHHDIQNTLYHWKKALELRMSNSTGSQIPKPAAPYLHAAYLYAREFQTMEELESVALDLDAMRIQSLLICERILGRLHRDMIFRLMYRGAGYADNLQYQRCIDLWCYALDLRIEKDSLLHNEVCFAAQALVRLFVDLHDKNLAGVLREKPNIADVFNAIRLLANQLHDSMRLLKQRPIFKRQQDNFDKILKVIAHFFYILFVISKTPEEQLGANCLLQDILLIQPCTSSGDTLLHMVVSKSTTMKTTTFFEGTETVIFPNAELGRWFIECGADVEAVNYNSSSPLHIASLPINYDPVIVNMLLQAGAHIDRRNGNGNHPHTMLKQIPECHINSLHFITLKCLAARKIIECKIPYCGEVPFNLVSFISIH